jgi:putative nucleotidyltransferase with HDIG domain
MTAQSRAGDPTYLAMSVAVGAAGLWLADSSADRYLADSGSATAAVAAVAALPIAAVPMYTRLALGRVPMLIQLLVLALVAWLMPSVLPAAGWQVLLSGAVGGLLVGASTRRGTVVAAGLWAGMASAAVFLLSSRSEFAPAGLVAGAAGSLLGGALSGALVLTLSPLAERLFGHVTSMTLLEALSYDHPLLRQLMTAAPGTFLHSTHLAVLCDAAAPAIAADALVLRAGALYHDVGKTRAPGFFIENQRGQNPHDALPPEESAAALRAHVSDGVELVTRYGLGPCLNRFVREHHGTSTMRSLAEKAGAEDVDLAVFQYPGPRPQSRETGLLMIADQVEATARSAQPATLEACRTLVQETVDRITAERQLTESGLTPSHLGAIVAALAEMVHAIHHRRMAYPVPRRLAPRAPTADDSASAAPPPARPASSPPPRA